MIDTPQLWLPDRLRERREDERLMSPGRSRRWMPGHPCCCRQELACGACDGGTAPQSLSVTIAGVVAKSPEIAPCVGTCPLLNDTFILDWESASETWEAYRCEYEYYAAFYDEALAQWITVTVSAQVRKTKSTGVYAVRGGAVIGSTKDPPGEGGWISTCASSTFAESLGTNAPDCFAFNALSLTFESDSGNNCTLAAATFEVTSL